ncbi:DUF2334 domain-containing protein [Ornithinibacillus massiliensis]|nr:DUF2334 domain-containing protein [Ornithinibacillus massiliensis]MBS3680751.1 DUF2334 domain-containing protein [Ornithinibacillus massiliensis]
MRYKKLSLWSVLFLHFFVLLQPVVTEAGNSLPTLDERKVLLTYYGTDDTTMANIHFLDSSLSGLFEQVDMIELDKLKEEDLHHHDIVVYYASKEGASKNKLELFAPFQGEIIGVGKDAQALPQFQDWQVLGMNSVHRVGGVDLGYPIQLLSVTPPAKAKVIVEGQKHSQSYPVVIQDGKASLITISNVFAEAKYAISASFYDLFQLSKPTTHPAYIRLEDISPVSDPELVYETANYLLNKHIPVYLAVIPTYVDPTTEEMVTLADKPKLLAVLDELVSRGAYIIAHGYTHTYRYQETGEGFEFWDSELNQPITTLDIKEIPEKLKPEDQFQNREEYDQYIQGNTIVETEYVTAKLEKSIHALTKLGFPPIAFEAPHYTMSSNGYQVASQYFSAIFGQIQASDRDWQVMFSPLFISKPTILSGMTLYPETIGYVDPNSINPMLEIEEAIDHVSQVPGSVISGFYHPYLGLDYLKEMIALMEAVPNMEWIQLYNETHYVRTDAVEIITSGNGEISVTSELSWKMDIMDKLAEKSLVKYLWLIVLVTAIFVSLFIIHIVTLRMRYRKRLFKERVHG